MATIHINKRPSEKNLYRRSLSFQENEVKTIKESDLMEIKVYDQSNVLRYTINTTGQIFLECLKDNGRHLRFEF